MVVDGVRVESAPEGDRVRLIAEIQYEQGTPERETCWFEVPSALEPELSRTGNPWLACLLPVAAHLGEPLRLTAPVEAVLLEGALDLLSVWRAWYPHLTLIAIEAPVGANVSAPGEGYREACFFSGGVDSAFTLLQRVRTRAKLPPDQTLGSLDLLSVHGLDIRLDSGAAFSRISTAAEQVAECYGCGLVPISTNLRQTRFRTAPWGSLSHGSLLAGIALALEPRYRRAIVSSSFDFTDQHPWGSHPLTDPLLSTSSLTMEHFGCRHRRAYKIAELASPDAAPLLRALRVCYHSQDGMNCGNCGKCYRVMAVLEMVGALERSALFPPGAYTLKRFRRCYAPTTSHSLLMAIRDFAQEHDRPDVVRACNQCWQLSAAVRPLVQLARRLRDHPRHSLAGKRLRRFLAEHLVL